jgi:hypothetical protein
MSGIKGQSPVFNVNRFNYAINDPDNIESAKLIVTSINISLTFILSFKHIRSKNTETSLRRVKRREKKKP